MHKKILFLAGIALLLLPVLLYKHHLRASLLPAAKDIVQKAVQNAYGENTYQAEWTLTAPAANNAAEEISLKIWQNADTDKRIILVAAPARLRGNAFLRIGKEVWYWEASAQKITKLHAAAMNQTWLNTQLTIANLVGLYDFTTDFVASFKNLVSFNNAQCYVIELVTNQEAAIETRRVLLWVNTKTFVIQKAEYYNEDDFLALTAITTQTQQTEGRTIPKLTEFFAPDASLPKNLLNCKTPIFNQTLPDNLFTLDNLKTIR